jgi:hypothetical protein
MIRGFCYTYERDLSFFDLDSFKTMSGVDYKDNRARSLLSPSLGKSITGFAYYYNK